MDTRDINLTTNDEISEDQKKQIALNLEYQRELQRLQELIDDIKLNPEKISSNDDYDYDHQFGDGFHVAFKFDKNYLYLPLHAAAKDNDIEKVNALMGACDIDQLDSKEPGKGFTALMWACRLGFYEIAKTLILNGANINHKEMISESYWRTPLSEAVLCGKNMEIVKLLLSKGASIEETEKCQYVKILNQCDNLETMRELQNLGFTTDNEKILKVLAMNISTDEFNARRDEFDIMFAESLEESDTEEEKIIQPQNYLSTTAMLAQQFGSSSLLSPLEENNQTPTSGQENIVDIAPSMEELPQLEEIPCRVNFR